MNNSLGDGDFEQPLPAIKTYKNDVASAVKHDNVSAIKIALAEQARSDAYDDLSKQNSLRGRKGIMFFVLSIVCVVIGVGVFWYFLNKSQTAVTTPIQRPNTVITTDTIVYIDVANKTDHEVIDLIQKQGAEFETQKDVDLNRIIPKSDSTDLTVRGFFNSINSYPPNDFLRSVSELFILGEVKNGAGKAKPYFLFQAENYERAYAGMLSWEPEMTSGISNLYNTNEYSVSFEDRVIKNRDVRALINRNTGEIVFLYTFLDAKTIVITADEKSLETITNAFLLAKRVQ